MTSEGQGGMAVCSANNMPDPSYLSCFDTDKQSDVYAALACFGNIC